MNTVVKKLVSQSILYNASALIFQSFITFYIIKYFDGIQWVLLGNMILAISLVIWYLSVAWWNHQRSLSVKKRLFYACIICILSTCMMQWNTARLLLLWFAFQWFWKWIYFCCLYLYEFEFVPIEQRVTYSSAQYAWKSLWEIVIPVVIWYVCTLFVLPHFVYLMIFLTSALIMVINALVIYNLPEFELPPMHHWHLLTVIKKTSKSRLAYLWLSWVDIAIPLIWTLLEVQILQKEQRSGFFQGMTKLVTLVMLLLILRYSHPKDTLRQLMFASILLWIFLILTPRWAGWTVLIVFSVAKSFLFPLFSTYEKPIWMAVMEWMATEWHSMLPVIIVKIIVYAWVRVLTFWWIYFALPFFSATYISYVLLGVTWWAFILIGILAHYINKQNREQLVAQSI